MNDKRRARLLDIELRLDALRTELEAVNEEEQEAFDNMPESLREGERGEKAQEALDALDSAMTAIVEAVDYVQSAR